MLLGKMCFSENHISLTESLTRFHKKKEIKISDPLFRSLNTSYKDHVTNEVVRRENQAAIGKYD